MDQALGFHVGRVLHPDSAVEAMPAHIYFPWAARYEEPV
jgi:hypothetical protein